MGRTVEAQAHLSGEGGHHLGQFFTTTRDDASERLTFLGMVVRRLRHNLLEFLRQPVLSALLGTIGDKQEAVRHPSAQEIPCRALRDSKQ